MLFQREAKIGEMEAILYRKNTRYHNFRRI